METCRRGYTRGSPRLSLGGTVGSRDALEVGPLVWLKYCAHIFLEKASNIHSNVCHCTCYLLPSTC